MLLLKDKHTNSNSVNHISIIYELQTTDPKDEILYLSTSNVMINKGVNHQ